MKRNRKGHGFVSLRVEGGMLPPEFLQVISSLKAPEQTGPDYGLSKHLNIKEEIGRYWRIAQDLWEDHKDRRNREDMNQNDVCIKYWLREFLIQVLGYRDVNAIPSVSLGNRVFPINYKTANGAVPLVLTTGDFDLDKSHQNFGDEGRRRPPHELLQEYLNAEDTRLWGIVSNGTVIRLLRDNPSLTRPAYIEADLEQMFEEELYSDFAVFWLTYHASRLTPKNDKPTNCVLEAWRNKAHETGERALGNLKQGVTQALRELGNGYIQHPKNENLRIALKEGSFTPLDYFQQLLRLIYRLIFLLTTEERNLLFYPDTLVKSKRLYEDGYSISRLREKALKKRNYDQHSDLWQGLCVTFKSLARGAEPLGLTALGGLFKENQCPHLDQGEIDNTHLLEAVRSLSFFRSGNTLARINYRDMDTEELGSVYESLLELHPRVDVDSSPWQFGFIGDEGEGNIQGSERKLTGSYYTPSSLVKELIKSALEPVMKQKVKDHPEDPIGALLKLNIIDPACGSGHFLLGAARHMANEIARLEAMPDTPNEQQRQHALREVVQHCIYGVDRNPLSVELCKTALWVETIEPGKPLTFLDPHIRCGDSLVGILDPKIIEDGIPNEAYKALTADDKEVCRELRRRNENQQTGGIQGKLFDQNSMATIAISTVDFDSMPEETIEQIDAKRNVWNDVQQNADVRQDELRSDLYVGAFFAEKSPQNKEFIPTSEDLYRVRHNLAPRTGVSEVAEKLARKYRFFHWHIAFADVMHKGGFDVIIGNPPWEKLTPDEKEFFEKYEPNIRSFSSQERKGFVKNSLENPFIAREWEGHCRLQFSAINFIKNSGRYTLFASGNLGKGDINSYRMFVELSFDAIKKNGIASLIAPDGLYNGANASKIRERLFMDFNLKKFYCFENNAKFWFPSVHAMAKFCFYVIQRDGQTKEFPAGFRITNDEKLAAVNNKPVSIPMSLIREFSPDTLAIMEFASQEEINIARKICEKYPKFGDSSNKTNFRRYMREIDMSNDSSLFCEDNSEIPLLEGRMVSIYDYRTKGYYSGRGRAAVWKDYNFGDSEKKISPQWYIRNENVPEKLFSRFNKYRIAYCWVSSPSNERSLQASLIPPNVICGNSVPTITIGTGNELDYAFLLAICNSLTIDFLVRKKVSLNLTFNIFDTLPLPRKYNGTNIEKMIVMRALQLACVGNEMSPFLERAINILGIPESQLKPVEERGRRAQIYSEIEALVATGVFGLTLNEIRYILDPEDVYGEDYPDETFRVFKSNEIKEFGEYRTQRLVLESWDRFVEDKTFDLTHLNDLSAMPRIQAELAKKEKELEELLLKKKSPSLPILFVEGITDKLIVEAAWSVFYPDDSIPFEIVPAHGTNQMGSLAGKGTALKQLLGDQMAFVLVDNDMEGRKLCNDGHLKPGGKWRTQNNGTLWCLLEPTEEFKTFANQYQIPSDCWPFTIEACFIPALRRQALKNGAYGFSGMIQHELLGDQEFSKKILVAYKEKNESHDDYFYFMAPAHEAKEKFAEWVTQPDHCTLKNYQPFEKIIKDLSSLINQRKEMI